MSFLRDTATLQLARSDARERGLSRGDAIDVTIDGRAVAVTIGTSPRIAPGHARIRAGLGGMPAGRTGWTSVQVAGVVAATPTGGED